MNRPMIGRLEALLLRIQRNAAEPRVARAEARVPAVEPVIEEEYVEEAVAAPVEEAVVPPIEEAIAPPVEEMEEAAPVTVGAYVPQYRAPEHESRRAGQPLEDEPMVEAVSGEFAVAEMPMELEELGPADETVEINIDEPEFLEPEERVSQPPESGRELVAAPHESTRLAVAAPATPDPNELELLVEEHDAPPASARNLKVAPATPVTSDVFDLEPIRAERPLEPPTRIEPAPVIDPAMLADVIRPAVMAADVAAFVGAARAPRPETFGILLDAALDL